MPSSEIRATVRVTGVVQGVGFRPFVYRRATAHGLGGTVRNRGDAGVEIVLGGPEAAVEAFLSDLRDPPPLARVESIETDRSPATSTQSLDEPEEFRIVDSVDSEGGTGTIPPDTGICENCLADIRDPHSRYHGYWATSCVDCGPRYTVIRDLPYDRPRTSMDAFPMCQSCRSEYEDQSDRRYHAQTIACPECGPTLELVDPSAGNRRTDRTGLEGIRATRKRLARGEIIALHGIGGTHLVCDATNTTTVERLRNLTNRPAKPFAVMAPSIECARSIAVVAASEAELLENVRRPIVVLDRDDEGTFDAVTPGLHTIGVMLPYAGIHHLLFGDDEHSLTLDGPLVMTSGNMPGEPMCVTPEGILDQLGSVIDAALVHDREIVARSDDSVVREVDSTRRFLRRSRGWVPQPLPRRSHGPPILAVGAEFDGTVAVAREDEVIPSQHLGNVNGPATDAFLRETVDHLRELQDVTPEYVACDAHPDFLTSKYARSDAETHPAVNDHGTESSVIQVQHHHAHAASLLGEHDRDKALVIVADGTGYGSDGTIWGGEVLEATHRDFTRVGGLDTFRLPGGEAAVEQPTRILASLLSDPERIDDHLVTKTPLDSNSAAVLREALAAGVNSPATTSAGRFLDAISAMLDVCSHREYEGQPAIELEAAAAGSTPRDVPLTFGRRGGNQVLDVRELAQDLCSLTDSESSAVVAATAQDAVARGLARIAVDTAQDRSLHAIGFSGGVALNDSISRTIRQCVEDAGLEYLGHDAVPPGDAGLSYGQSLVATATLQT